jgi:hypothetical protein
LPLQTLSGAVQLRPLTLRRLSRRLKVPVAASSLLQIPTLRTIVPSSKSIGILTFDGSRLNETHLNAIGIHDHSQIHIAGPPQDGAMKKYIRDGAPFEFAVLQQELVDTAREHIRRHPDIGALVLECTQFPPFSHGLQQATGLPVWDVFTLASWLYSGVARVPFAEMTKEETVDARRGRPRTAEELLEHGQRH